MIRYIMAFSVPPGKQQAAQKIIDNYFHDLDKHGPVGCAASVIRATMMNAALCI